MTAPGDDGGRSLAVEGLLSTWSDGVLQLVLNRSAVRNALSISVRRALIRAVRAAEADVATRVVLLTGTDPVFSAGVDHTGALELALSCAFVIASDRATFADTHAAVGLLPGWGQSALLPRAVGVRLARQMMLTGEPIGADTALRAGLVTEVVPHERLLDRAHEIAAAVRDAHPAAVEATLGLLAEGEGLGLAHALGLEAQAGLRWRTDAVEVGRRFAARTQRSKKEH
jgi:enoyl-CoA hydratase/carnithine racemase